jgi:hypothetical protein
MRLLVLVDWLLINQPEQTQQAEQTKRTNQTITEIGFRLLQRLSDHCFIG